MTKDTSALSPLHWFLSAAVALIGSIILFDASAGINWAIWVLLAVAVTLLANKPRNPAAARPAALLAIGAILAAGADARTTDTPVHVGIFWLTAVLLAAFLYTVTATDGAEPKLLALITSPFYAAARVITSALREIGAAFRAGTDSPSKVVLRRVIIVAPVVLLLLFLLGGADPVIHSAIDSIGAWIPIITFSPKIPFFGLLFIVMLGACSRLPQWNFGFPARTLSFGSWPSSMDAMVLVGSTLATLVAFLILQVVYLFIQLPNQVGNGVTYAEYARRGFGQLCIVVTIVAAVVVVAERIRHSGEPRHSRTLKTMEIALIAAAGLILLSAQRRVVLYEEAYGYTLARVHATAYIVFMAAFLILLVNELRHDAITPALGRRSAFVGITVVLVLLYWNDQAWIMNRNIDRVRTTGKFDSKYAATLSDDALPVLLRRKSELPPAAWADIEKRAACAHCLDDHEWYEWNSARAAAVAARREFAMPAASQPIRNPASASAQAGKPAS